MRQHTARRLIPVIPCAAALMLAGCATDTPGASPSGHSTAHPPASATADDMVTEKELPIAAWFTSVLGDAMSTEAMSAEHAATEKKIAECMAEQGFSYLPTTADPASMDAEDHEWGTATWAAENGYGVFATSGEESSAPADPNIPLVEAMSSTEQEAYYAALYGPNGSPEDGGTASGCSGKAQSETPRGALLYDEEFLAMKSELNDAYAAWNDNPQVISAAKAWAQCMSEAGFAQEKWNSPADPEPWFWEKRNGLSDPEATQNPQWQELAQQEIDAAVADHACRTSSEWDKAKYAAEFEAETAFLDAHQTTFESLAARHGHNQK